MDGTSYPVSFSVDYPDRELDRVTSIFRIFTVCRDPGHRRLSAIPARALKSGLRPAGDARADLCERPCERTLMLDMEVIVRRQD
jgi:hypothetical protein